MPGLDTVEEPPHTEHDEDGVHYRRSKEAHQRFAPVQVAAYDRRVFVAEERQCLFKIGGFDVTVADLECFGSGQRQKLALLLQ